MDIEGIAFEIAGISLRTGLLISGVTFGTDRGCGGRYP